MVPSNKRIFITGGAGFLGRHIVARYYHNNEIVIYSRDEAKHYYLKKQFPKVTCVIGDVSNLDNMMRSSKGCDIGIFTASLKQIEAVTDNPIEAANTIIYGAFNSRRICEENGFEAGCFISSDKRTAATTIYGAMKYVAGECFIVNAKNSNPRLSTAVYGNVLNSTGSVIPLIWNSIKHDRVLTLFSDQMTRFLITVDDAVNLIEVSLSKSGVNVVPKLKSHKIIDLFDIYKRRFGLKYKIGQPRTNEKIHEMLISKEEIPRTDDRDPRYFFIHSTDIYTNSLERVEYTSDLVCMSVDELDSVLSKFNYFKPI